MNKITFGFLVALAAGTVATSHEAMARMLAPSEAALGAPALPGAAQLHAIADERAGFAGRGLHSGQLHDGHLHSFRHFQRRTFFRGYQPRFHSPGGFYGGSRRY
ncbi:MAG: hypothetical protein RQ966_10710 [Acetobacteraceae bacterium]|nr:hypothetical protein [Acetobacteraceae bacterium]